MRNAVLHLGGLRPKFAATTSPRTGSAADALRLLQRDYAFGAHRRNGNRFGEVRPQRGRRLRLVDAELLRLVGADGRRVAVLVNVAVAVAAIFDALIHLRFLFQRQEVVVVIILNLAAEGKRIYYWRVELTAL